MRTRILLIMLAAFLILGERASADAGALLASFESGLEVLGWSGRDGGRAEWVEGPTTDGNHYLRFTFSPRPSGWPAVVLATPVLRLTDWSGYNFMSIDVYNPGNESLALLLRLDDTSGKRYNRSVQLPPQEWTRWNIPIQEINLNRSGIVAAHFHFDRPAEGGTIYLDNWRLIKGQVPALQIPTPVVSASAPATINSTPGYQVVVADTMTKIRIDVPYTGEYNTEANISAAGNEAEGFQLVLLPHGVNLSDVTLQASALQHTGGKGSISADNITCNQVGYVKTSWPFYSVERAGWWPDPLLYANRFTVRDGDTQPVWVTVNVPAGTPAGVYTGSITMRPTNTTPTSIPIKVRVWDFTLPREGSLPLAFTYFEDIAQRIHGLDTWVAQDLQHKYYDLLLAHRIAPDNIYRRTPPSVTDVSYWNERGLTAFNIAQVGSQASYTDEEVRKITGTIAAALAQYQAAGLDKKAYVYGFDEIGPSVYPGLQKMYGAIGQKFPRLKRLVAASITPAGYGYVDAWANTVETYNPTLAEARRVAGDEVWMYLSMSGRHPYPNWFIEYPAIEARLVWWMGYRYNIDGFLYYAVNHYNYKSGPMPQPIDASAGPYTKWDPASFVTTSGEKWNGDGLLIYASTNGPLASIRLANIRDGLEDYEYLHLLQQKLVATGRAENAVVAANQVKMMFSEVVTGLTTFTHDPVTLRQARDSIAEAIESLK